MTDLEKVVQFAIKHGFSTGHADNVDDLLSELTDQLEGRLLREHIGFRVLVDSDDRVAVSLAKELAKSRDGEMVMLKPLEMIAMQDPHRVFVLRTE